MTNSGTITADHAIDITASPVGLVQLVLHNSGTLNGAVVVNAGSPAPSGGGFVGAQVYNSGHINGDVKLLDGADDYYDGSSGTLSGTLTLGGGLNLAHLGNDGETVQGGSGENHIIGGTGANHVTGGSGSTFYAGGGGDDVLDGGSGNYNFLLFTLATTSVTVDLSQTSQQNTGFGHDTISHFQNLVGSAQSDYLTGDTGNNIIDAGAGGNDVMDGGGGFNLASFQYATSAVTVSLAAQGGAQSIGSGRSETLTNFQGLIGSQFADHLTGGSGNDLISGGGGRQ